MRIFRKIVLIFALSIVLSSCSSMSDKCIDLLTELLTRLKPVYIKTKKLINGKKINRKIKAKYLIEFNTILKRFLDERLPDFNRLIKEFKSMGDNAKLNVSIEFNNYYYDVSSDYSEDEESSDNEINTQISFYELLNEHRTIISINSKKYREYSRTYTLKRYEKMILQHIVKNYVRGNFNNYLTNIIEQILYKSLMYHYDKIVEQEKRKLTRMRRFMTPAKFQKMVKKNVTERIERSKGLMSVYVKRFIKKDLIKKLGENYSALPLMRIKTACNEIIEDCKKIIKDIYPKYKKEKEELKKYRKVYSVEYPIFEALIERWKKLNPMFSFSNRRRTYE